MTMEEMECSKCGADLISKQKFCTECGIEMDWSDSSNLTLKSASDTHFDSNGTVRRFTKNQKIAIGFGILGLLAVVAFAGGNTSTPGNQDSITGVENSNSQNSGQTDPQVSGISVADAIRVISEKVGSQLNQDDVTRSLMFPNLTDVSNFWSIPYLVVIIYPDKDSLISAQSTFESDFSNQPSGWEWMSCQNVMAAFDSKFKDDIDAAMSTWCAG